MGDSRQTFQTLKRMVSPSIFIAFMIGMTLLSLALLLPGIVLSLKGGSAFYAVSGALLLASGIQLFRRRASAIHFAALNFAVTWIWALSEVGTDGWALLPRVDLICALLPIYFLTPVRSRLQPDRLSVKVARFDRFLLPAAIVLVVAVSGMLGLNASRDTFGRSGLKAETRPIAAVSDNTGWRHTGGDAGGTRFSGLSLINRGNAQNLKQVWEHVDPVPANSSATMQYKDQATPLQIDDKLFLCLSDNSVLALDAEDGALRWRHDPKIDLRGVKAGVCRGVSYSEDAAAHGCKKRVITGTLDARLIALDAETGKRCPDFGENGEISLKTGMGAFEPGMYSVTSPPLVAGGVIVVGGLVQDNISVGEPSGVIRAFDARTGKFVWAWDLGRATPEMGEPKKGNTYTLGTPNAWSLFSADAELGLVYVPIGNATPDFVGAHRNPKWEKYSSSVVALDLKTGKVRWSFQLVHHDLWDYDASAQPVLFDFPTPNGPVPALVQASKQGDLFVLDRRTGAPLSSVEEKLTPQTDVPGEWTSKTQPFSVAMPSLSGPVLREEDMWGVMPFDQLYCRILFRQHRYDGAFTPPSLGGSIQYPGQAGGVDWGSLTVDNGRNLMFVPSFRMAATIKLVSRADADKGVRFSDPQDGTPYRTDNSFFMTKLGVPCQRPPYGLLTAIDLTTKSVIWSEPLGTAEELGPRGIASHLPITIGAAPIVGGAISTAGDVLFVGATGDRRLRAIDSLTGKELWSVKTPEGNQATPITYRAPRSGRQMVVFVSGNYVELGKTPPRVPTHIVAYALP